MNAKETRAENRKNHRVVLFSDTHILQFSCRGNDRPTDTRRLLPLPSHQSRERVDGGRMYPAGWLHQYQALREVFFPFPLRVPHPPVHVCLCATTKRRTRRTLSIRLYLAARRRRRRCLTLTYPNNKIYINRRLARWQPIFGAPWMGEDNNPTAGNVS